MDLVQASKEAKVCSSVFQAERNDDAVWDALVDKAADIAAFYNIDPSIPRRAGRQQHRENVEADTPSAYWSRAVYFPFLDHLVSELNELLVKPLPGFQAQYTRYLLLLLMSRYYHSCICICVTVIVTIKLFKFQVSFKTFQKSVWKTSITTMAMTCI